jgi:hypothetical protein
MPGCLAITSAYAPDFLIAGGSVELEGDMAALAVRAPDRILGENSEWRALWGEDGAEDVRRARDSNPRGTSLPLAVFKTAAIGH